MELLGNVIVLASSLVCLAATGSGAWSEARSAIAVTQALSVCGLLNWTVRTIACLGCWGWLRGEVFERLGFLSFKVVCYLLRLRFFGEFGRICWLKNLERLFFYDLEFHFFFSSSPG